MWGEGVKNPQVAVTGGQCMDPAVLLQSKGDDAPSGDNLEYDPVFTEMELAALPKEETQIGEEITEAADPDYAEVIEKALDVLARSHDLRAAVFLADAILHTEGLTGFAKATTYIRGCLEEFWETCHPELDEEDDNDPTMRINAVAGLAGADTVLRSLRRTALTDSRSFGRLSLRDIEIAEGAIAPAADTEHVADAASVNAAFKDTDAETLAALMQAAQTAREDVKAIDAVFSEQTPGQGPDLDPLTKTLLAIERRLADFAGVAPSEDAGQDDDLSASAPAGGGAGGGGGAQSVGGINSPQDVANALERIIAYYQRNEPSSPLPILLERAKRLVNADFMTIVRDMAPDGVGNVNLIGGIEEEDGY